VGLSNFGTTKNNSSQRERGLVYSAASTLGAQCSAQSTTKIARLELGTYMKIGVIGSMQFTEKMIEARDALIALGHDAFLTNLAAPFIGKTDEEKEVIKLAQKATQDPIREFWNLMQGADAMLVLNLDKNGVKNYIGGNALMEIGFAHVLGQKVFLLNPIPEIQYYKTEIESVKPVIINGDFSKIV